ncbi:MAG: protein kinase [Myxococcota bacterium]|nr:protein kinase [Myxococcota bacterium]MEC9442424.1 protein kinase [Myxococcota bacterium]
MVGLPDIGDVIDDTYEITRMIGKGGFGAVFLAKHIPMQRDVALKMLIAHGPDPSEMIERFKREVMAIRILSHPNTVRIFDFRDDAENLHLYYTMEYLKGVTLKDVLRNEGAQSPLRVKRILVQALKSLGEAHAHGIVHRDLKPANIMIVDMHGEQDFVKVLDFGIAKILEHEEDEENPLTSAGMLVGTLRYMSPEQIRGHAIGPHTDIYSLGLIANELLSGKSAFAGASRWELIQAQAGPEPIEFLPELQGSPLIAVLQKALAKETSERYSGTEQMLRDLNHIPDHTLSSLPLVLNAGASLQNYSNSSSSQLAEHLTPPSSAANAASDVSQSSRSQRVPVAQAPAAHQSTPAALPHPPMPMMSGAPTSNITAPAPVIPQTPPLTEEVVDDTGPIRNSFVPRDDQPLENSGIEPYDEPAQSAAEASTGAFDFEPMPVPAESSTGGNAKVLVGVGALVVLLLLGGGGLMLATSSSESDKTTTASANIADKPTETAPAATLPPLDDIPVEPEKKMRKIKLTLENGDASIEADVYKGEETIPVASVPGSLEIEEGQTLTLRVEAAGYETFTQTVDDQTPESISIALNKLEAKKGSSQSAPPSSTERGDKEKEKAKDSAWADVTPKTTKTKPEKKKPKKKIDPKKIDIPTF